MEEDFMKAAVFTMVKNEKILLPLWLEYYSRYFKDIHVINHNTKDGSIEETQKEFDFTLYNLPTEDPENMPYIDYRVDVVSKYQEKLLKKYDWVVFADVDEFIIPNPDKYTDLDDFICNYAYKSKEKYIVCTGREVLHGEKEKPINWNKPILKQRKHWWPHIACFKPAISRVSLKFAHGFHYVKEFPGEERDMHTKEYILGRADPNVVLVHLKQIDRNLPELREGQPRVAEGKGKEKIPKKYKEIL